MYLTFDHFKQMSTYKKIFLNSGFFSESLLLIIKQVAAVELIQSFEALGRGLCCLWFSQVSVSSCCLYMYIYKQVAAVELITVICSIRTWPLDHVVGICIYIVYVYMYIYIYYINKYVCVCVCVCVCMHVYIYIYIYHTTTWSNATS